MTMKAVIVNAGNRSSDVLHVSYGDGRNHLDIDIPVGGQHTVSLRHGVINNISLDCKHDTNDKWDGEKVVEVKKKPGSNGHVG